MATRRRRAPHYEEAATCHRRALAARPDFALAHSNPGNVLHALKRFDEAVASYRYATELNPNFADAWSNLGTTLQHAGRDDANSGLLNCRANPQLAAMKSLTYTRSFWR